MADTDKGTSGSRFDWSKIWRKSDGSDGSSSWGLLEFLILSALMLYWEICLIRWVSAEVRLFAYYKNLSLLAAFLGFGVGLLTVHRQKNWLRSCVLWLAVMVTLIVVYPHSPLRIDQAPAFFEEYIWSVQITGIGVISKFYGVLLGVFALNALAFVAFVIFRPVKVT